MFDFGLTRELRKEDMVNEDEYKITGLTGTRRWMAPENCQSKPYGLSADVYSFCLLFWHVISLKLPFKGYNQQEHMTRVAIGGEKPNPNKMRISQFLRNVVAEGWSTNTSERPKITRLAELMKLELIERRMDEKNKDARILDRSGYLMDQTIESYLAGQN